LVTGHKLLLADDSITIQKVVHLTFADEGIQVTAVSDGEQAIKKLEEERPDIVLADVFMPGLSGYEVCERIKRDERFRDVPVMLLVGTFEPFDEKEARRVGADDVLTKPFQSIRQLVEKVGSLLSGKEKEQAEPDTGELAPPASEARDASQYVTSPLAPPPVERPADPFAGAEMDDEMIQVTAGQDQTPGAPQEQPAASPSGPAFSDTLEMEPAPVVEAHAPEAPVAHLDQPAPSTDLEMEDELLELDDIEPFPVAAADEYILDIVEETPAELPEPALEPLEMSPASLAGEAVVAPSTLDAVGATDESVWSAAAVVVETPAEPQPEPVAAASETAAATGGGTLDPARLSPEVIDAIARRVVEHLSDNVIREIAWEVVPQLAELLIKRRLEEEKRGQ
jgi:CheY-like chemotaxis protein